ncbi:unnamed protein product [Orchesella dallaii]|uniref:Uncharacterized protein n=1 Tax=Orchesella dallaii TaxID=48710 RepID=A0ABP1PT35_9HEXA
MDYSREPLPLRNINCNQIRDENESVWMSSMLLHCGIGLLEELFDVNGKSGLWYYGRSSDESYSKMLDSHSFPSPVLSYSNNVDTRRNDNFDVSANVYRIPLRNFRIRKDES